MVDMEWPGARQPEVPFLERHLPVQLQGLPLEDLEDLEMLVNLPAGFRARIGLNETELTRALARGDFSSAEKLIEEASDPEYLNDGALAATPLNIVLTGRSSFFHQSRNLYLAHLLLVKGANPNLRIPNHDMETASESPIEMLLQYYLKLTEVFGLPGSGLCRTSYRPSSFEETELMDTVGLNGEIGGLGPGQITAQARQLLLVCLDHGGDPNLPTTDAAKSIYHLAVTAARPDTSLLERMLELGANVNLADVHNTTPLMDIIALGDEARSRRYLQSLRDSGRNILLDSQNCSLQSATWRAMHQGQLGLVQDLLSSAGSEGGSGARVEFIPRPSRIRVAHQSCIKMAVPALLSPFLGSSPVRPSRKRQHGRGAGQPEWCALAADQVLRAVVAPVVDKGWLQGPEVAERVADLVRQHTNQPLVGDATLVDSEALISLMFGQVSAGLRQLAVRAIMRQLLFSRTASEVMETLEKISRESGFVTASLAVASSGANVRRLEGGGEVLRQDYELELGDELEFSYKVQEGGESSRSLAPRLASFDDAQSEAEDMSEILNTLDKLDRELEVVRTDCVLQSLDRDLAAWEGELEATLGRITRYQEELRNLQLPGSPSARRREACRAVGAEEARRRSENLMEELRNQRSILIDSEVDIAAAERVVAGAEGLANELQYSMASLSLEGELLQARLEVNREDQGEVARRHLDDNWSLGSGRGLADEAGLHKHFSREAADAASTSSSSSGNESTTGACRLSPQHTTDRLVRSLQVSVSVREPPQPPPRASSLNIPQSQLTSSSSDGEEAAWSQPWGRETSSSPTSMASNLVTLNSRLFQQRRRIGAGTVATVGTLPGQQLPEDDPGEEEATSEDDETSVSSHSSSDEDTWGGAFSLRNTQSLRSHQSGPNQAAVVTRLTPRTLTAVTNTLAIPEMLRTLFSVEAARLQLCLGLAAHQAIACDRNCEGEESDSDSDDDFLASDTESEDEVPDLEPTNLGSGPESGDSSDEDGESNLSSLSHPSWLGSQVDLGPGATSSPRPPSSGSGWLSDREDLERMRGFLARPSPGSDFNRSTASEEDE